MNEQTFYNDLLLFSFLLAVIVFIALFFFSAPYGRHIRKGAPDAVAEFIHRPLPPSVQNDVDKISVSGGTALVVAENEKVIGVIHLKDIVKGGLKDRFERFRAMGIKTIMITGAKSEVMRFSSCPKRWIVPRVQTSVVRTIDMERTTQEKLR